MPERSMSGERRMEFAAGSMSPEGLVPSPRLVPQHFPEFRLPAVTFRSMPLAEFGAPHAQLLGVPVAVKPPLSASKSALNSGGGIRARTKFTGPASIIRTVPSPSPLVVSTLALAPPMVPTAGTPSRQALDQRARIEIQGGRGAELVTGVGVAPERQLPDPAADLGDRGDLRIGSTRGDRQRLREGVDRLGTVRRGIPGSDPARATEGRVSGLNKQRGGIAAAVSDRDTQMTDGFTGAVGEGPRKDGAIGRRRAILVNIEGDIGAVPQVIVVVGEEGDPVHQEDRHAGPVQARIGSGVVSARRQSRSMRSPSMSRRQARPRWRPPCTKAL